MVLFSFSYKFSNHIEQLVNSKNYGTVLKEKFAVFDGQILIFHVDLTIDELCLFLIFLSSIYWLNIQFHTVLSAGLKENISALCINPYLWSS